MYKYLNLSENVMYSDDGHIKVIDFGCSDRIEKKTGFFPANVPPRGTFGYFDFDLVLCGQYSVTQEKHKKVLFSTDVFAAFLIFYELLAGEEFFFGIYALKSSEEKCAWLDERTKLPGPRDIFHQGRMGALEEKYPACNDGISGMLNHMLLGRPLGMRYRSDDNPICYAEAALKKLNAVSEGGNRACAVM